MIRITIPIMAFLLCALGAGEAAGSEAGANDTLSFGRFGKISLYRGASEPHDVVLFLSGDGGWNQGVISMAQHLADRSAIVAGVDIRAYLEELEKAPQACVSPAADLEKLSHYLQAKLGLKHYLEPTLVGYSSGATLVYAALAEAPGGMFKGALSLGFCPDLDLKKPLCRGSGIEATPRRSAQGNLRGVDLLPAKSLSGKWISLQGELDEVCLAPATQKFVSAVPGGELIMLPKVGHGYSVEKNWVPQYEAAFDRIIAPPAAAN
jgi:type IV secretory pathway VirJ component